MFLVQFFAQVLPESLGCRQVRALETLLDLSFEPFSFDRGGFFALFPAAEAVADDLAAVLVVPALDLLGDKFFQIRNQRYFHGSNLAKERQSSQGIGAHGAHEENISSQLALDRLFGHCVESVACKEPYRLRFRLAGFWPGRTGVRARAFKAGLCIPKRSIGKLTKPSARAGDLSFTR